MYLWPVHCEGDSNATTFENIKNPEQHAYSDDFPVGSGDERVFAVHVVEVGEVSLFDLTDGRYQKRSAFGHFSLAKA